MVFSIHEVQSVANWFLDRTGIKPSLGEAFELHERHALGLPLLFCELPRREYPR